MANKFTEIRHKIVHIQQLLSELESEIKQDELTEVLNTREAEHINFKNGTYLLGSTVNELEDSDSVDCEYTHIWTFALVIIFMLVGCYLYIH